MSAAGVRLKPIKIPFRLEVAFFFAYRVPIASLWLGTLALNIVVVAHLYDHASLFGVRAGMLAGTIIHQLLYVSMVAPLLCNNATNLRTWLGIPSQWLLFPPFPVLLLVLFPGIRWLFPIPLAPNPETGECIVGPSVVAAASESHTSEPSEPSVPLAEVFQSTVPRCSVHPLASSSDEGETLEVGRFPRGGSRRSEPYGFSVDSRDSDSEIDGPSARSEHTSGRRRVSRSCLPSTAATSRLARPSPPLFHERDLASCLPYRSIQDVYAGASSTHLWGALWFRYQSDWNLCYFAIEMAMNFWLIVVYIFGVRGAGMVNELGVESTVFKLLSVGVPVRVLYFIAMCLPHVAPSASLACGALKSFALARDFCTSCYCLLIAVNVGIRAWEVEPLDSVHAAASHAAAGFTGEPARVALEAFRWTALATLVLGFLGDFIGGIVLLCDPESESNRKPQSGCCGGFLSVLRTFLRACFMQVMLLLAPFSSVILRAPRHLPGVEVDNSALSLLYSFVTANGFCRKKKLLFLLSEELLDLSVEGHIGRTAAVPMEAPSLGPFAAGRARSAPETLGLLSQTLATEPFARRHLRKLFWNQHHVLYPQLSPVARTFRTVTELAYIPYILFSLFVSCSFPPQSDDIMMMPIFILNSLSFLCVLPLIPASVKYLHFLIEVFPFLRRISVDLESQGPKRFAIPQLVAFRRISAFYSSVEVAGMLIGTEASCFFPMDILQRVSEYVPVSSVDVSTISAPAFDELCAQAPILPVARTRQCNPLPLLQEPRSRQFA